MTNFPTRFQQQVNPVQPPMVVPGREIQNIERRRFPSGRVVEFVHHVETAMQPPMTLRTSLVGEINRHLDDGLVPRDITDIAECSICQRLVVASLHALMCQGGCGRTICTACVNYSYSNQFGAFVCRECAAPWVVRIWRKLF